MMRPLAWAGGGLALLASALVLVPVRHQVRLERSEGNPVQRLVWDSRSLAGVPLPAWKARLEGAEHWGNAREGFFVAPGRPVDIHLRAWPGFSQILSLEPVSASEPTTLLGQGEREAFRTWFVALLEQQLDGPSPAWEPAQRDCAGLLRFAFREAWGPHTEAWRERTGFQGSPVASDPGALLGGPWRSSFPTPQGWQPFAKGAFLRSLACLQVSRDPYEAQPGDLLFFTRGGAHAQPDHAMAFVRPDASGQPVLLYHTGPEGSGLRQEDGEVRRVTLDDLLHHPDAAFRPVPENPAFAGVYRWKILCGGLEQALLSDPSLSSQP